jgi:hypothetical protein
MAQDTEHEQALQERADALVAEQQLLQKRLLQLQQELELEADAVQQLATGATSSDLQKLQVYGVAGRCRRASRTASMPACDTSKCSLTAAIHTQTSCVIFGLPAAQHGIRNCTLW